MSANCHVVIAVAVCIAATLGGCGGDGGDKPKPSDDGGAIFFESLNSHDLVRLDHCGDNGCDSPIVIATNLSTYGGLVPWEGSLLAATESGRIVQVNPWCKGSSCPVSTVVDVASALGPGDHGLFKIAGMTWCNSALFIAFGGESAATGVLRCANCKLGDDCTKSCSLVNGGAEPGNGTHQLSAFSADIACLEDSVLVADNTNFRVQTIPTSCVSADCNVQTFTSGLKYPLGLAVVDSGKRVLVTLDEGIVSVGPQGTVQSEGAFWEIVAILSRPQDKF